MADDMVDDTTTVRQTVAGLKDDIRNRKNRAIRNGQDAFSGGGTAPALPSVPAPEPSDFDKLLASDSSSELRNLLTRLRSEFSQNAEASNAKLPHRKSVQETQLT